jgi:hypothetical protein
VFAQGQIIAVLNVKIVKGMVDFTAARLDGALRHKGVRERIAVSQAGVLEGPWAWAGKEPTRLMWKKLRDFLPWLDDKTAPTPSGTHALLVSPWPATTLP